MPVQMSVVPRPATSCLSPVSPIAPVALRAATRLTEAEPRSLRALAAAGELRRVVATMPGEGARLRSEAFATALPLVWERHTRPLEARKGHRWCACGVRRLAPDCADRFTDDLESVVTALLSYGRPISNLEGWIVVRMSNAIKDGYRVRRAREMGAQQRVRVPARLALRLGSDPWLLALAERVLQWVGVRQTAGAGLWPLSAWAQERAAMIGHGAQSPTSETVAAELKVVLVAMRDCDPAWFEKYVEQPLGRKWAPVAVEGWQDGETAIRETAYLDLVPDHERADARLAEAAATSLAMIRTRLAAGGEPNQVVADALTEGFLSGGSLRDELGRVPGSGDPADAVTAVLADTAAFQRLVIEVLEIVA